MKKNNILDYEQVEEILKEITKEKIIREEKDIGKTEYGLPIKHYVVGEGENEIVISGAAHGSEIISTDFVLKLMNEINNDYNEWKCILDEFKIHFIPMLNPEGYLITTSAVRKLIPRDMPQDDAEKICKKYYLLYKQDDSKEPLDKKQNFKKHQKMFETIDYTCIPDKYGKIRNSLKNIFEKYPDLPKGCIQLWSANGNGIDIQANSIYNPKIINILNNEKIFMTSIRHNNIDTSHPGPMNCPYDKEKGFKIEAETRAISNLLEGLNEKGKLFSYINYHSTGGLIFQRPAIVPEEMDISEDEIEKKEIVNYMFSRLYAEKTYKNKGIDNNGIDKKETTKYIVKTGNAMATSSNDILRLKYPQNLLVELSGMGGNPIGPYGDINENYANLIKSNLDAIKYVLRLANLSQIIAKCSYKVIRKLEGDKEYDNVIKVLDIIYDEFTEKIKQLDQNNLIKEDKSQYER